ncbi:hypothetical protein Celaphus_00009856 [Cervus elaphus hippelaphus]|uniref:Uncharacterized protein n=1 Tax=Cervus elaphus hippelaphus TaxID=46360 RepID=A0A212C019_CEREH|nr:hypothetical protein Celaphus_00009856 [Cervus elaphus hippelaphus]
MVAQQPSLASKFGKHDSLFGSCYGQDMASWDINREDEKGGFLQNKSREARGSHPLGAPLLSTSSFERCDFWKINKVHFPWQSSL